MAGNSKNDYVQENVKTVQPFQLPNTILQISMSSENDFD